MQKFKPSLQASANHRQESKLVSKIVKDDLKGLMEIHWRFAKNAAANLGRGSASAILAVLLPIVLVRHMTPSSYAVWVLVLQTASYASYLNLGLQTAIGRYVAYANEKGDAFQRDTVFSTAFAGLCCAALVAIVCLVASAMAAPAIFPSVPGPLIPQMRLALLIVGFAMAVELPASAWNGVFTGIERYEIPAFTIGGARLLSAVGIIAAALAGHSLVVMASIIASANLLCYVAQYACLRHIAPDIRFHVNLVRRETVRELSGYCFALMIFSFSTLLVTGLDLVLVGRFQFSMVAPYSVSASMVMLIMGLLYSLINVIMPHSAALHAGQKSYALGKLTISSTRISVLLLILTGMPILIYAGPIMRLWIGQQYVAGGSPVLRILIVANIIRLVGASYSTVLVSAGQQRFIKVTPLAEGISNLVASVLLGLHFGAIGVALGTLFGSCVSVGTHLCYSMARTRAAIALSRRDFVVSGVFLPLLCTSPLLAVAVASVRGLETSLIPFVGALLLSLIGAGWLMIRTQGAAQNA